MNIGLNKYYFFFFFLTMEEAEEVDWMDSTAFTATRHTE